MNFNDLLPRDVDAEEVLLMRHAPPEPDLRKALPKLAIENPKLFNAYQQSQRVREEKMLGEAKHLAAFIGHRPGEALFIALYENRGSQKVSREAFWRIPENRELRQHGMVGPSRPYCLWFDLEEERNLAGRKGNLVVRWGEPGRSERAWARWASKNELPILSEARSLLAELGPQEDDEQDNPIVEDLTVIREHKRLERDPSVSAKVKQALGYQCQACGFRFEEMYPGIKDPRYIEAHHLISAWTLRDTKTVHKNPRADFAVLCANCHRMIHRFESPGDLAGFRAAIRKPQ